MKLYFFAKFHITEGREQDAEKAMRLVLGLSRKEPGCIYIRAFHSTSDSQVFLIHSCWADEQAFDEHANLPHTIAFLRAMEGLVDQPAEMNRTLEID